MSPLEPEDNQGDIAQLFVYGTLQPGRLRWPYLEPFARGHRPATVPGRIYDAGFGWPVADFDRSDEQVPGTLIELDPHHVEGALTVLDEVEATATDLLRRIVVTTTDGVPAWTYHCDQVAAGFTPIECWNPADER